VESVLASGSLRSHILLADILDQTLWCYSMQRCGVLCTHK
jgi:hypothetical protein